MHTEDELTYQMQGGLLDAEADVQNHARKLCTSGI